MAVLYTFSALFASDNVQPPIMKASKIRSGRIVPSSASIGSTQGSLSSDETEDVITIYTQEDCWIALGSNPTAQAEGSGSMFLASGERVYFGVTSGTKLAAIGT